MPACAFCGKTLRPRQEALQCDVCQRRQHRTCGTGMPRDVYRGLKKIPNSIPSWHCSQCPPDPEAPVHDDISFETRDVVAESTRLSLPIDSTVPTLLLSGSTTPPPRSPTDAASFNVSTVFDVPQPLLEESIVPRQIQGPLPDDLPVLTFTMLDCGSKRGRCKLADSLDYSYTVKRRKNEVTYWECSMRQKDHRCPASVIERAGSFLRGSNNHIHPPQVGAATNLQIQTAVRTRAQDDVYHPGPALVQDVIMDIVDEKAPNPSIPTLPSLVRLANRKRQCLRPDDPAGLDFEIMMEHIPDDFLRGDVSVKERRHIIFASNHQLDLLSKAKTWYMDGTFRVVKAPFTQLWSINAFIVHEENVKQVPLVYALMSGKNKKDYRKVCKHYSGYIALLYYCFSMFIELLILFPHFHPIYPMYLQVLKAVLDLLPTDIKVKTFVVDFEAALWRAIEELFPEKRLQGCVFHWTQAVFRHVQEYGTYILVCIHMYDI